MRLASPLLLLQGLSLNRRWQTRILELGGTVLKLGLKLIWLTVTTCLEWQRQLPFQIIVRNLEYTFQGALRE